MRRLAIVISMLFFALRASADQPLPGDILIGTSRPLPNVGSVPPNPLWLTVHFSPGKPAITRRLPDFRTPIRWEGQIFEFFEWPGSPANGLPLVREDAASGVELLRFRATFEGRPFMMRAPVASGRGLYWSFGSVAGSPDSAGLYETSIVSGETRLLHSVGVTRNEHLTVSADLCTLYWGFLDRVVAVNRCTGQGQDPREVLRDVGLIRGLQVLPDGDLLVSTELSWGGFDRFLLYRLEAGTLVPRLLMRGVTAFALNPEGTGFLSREASFVVERSVEDGRELDRLRIDTPLGQEIRWVIVYEGWRAGRSSPRRRAVQPGH